MGSIRLSSDRISDLMEFARIASCAQDIQTLRSETLLPIRRAFRSDSTILWLIDQNNMAIQPLEVNIQHRFFPMYRDYYFRKNPFDPTNLGSFRGTALSMERIVPYNDFQRSEYYNDFIRPQKIRRQMAVYIRLRNRLTSLICTHRSSNRMFNDEDLAAGDMVSRHLSVAFDRIQMIEEVKKKGSFFRMILDSTDAGILVLDLQKRPVFINRKAADICAAIPPPVLEDCDALERYRDQEVGLGSLPVRERIIWVSPSEKCLFRIRLVNRILADSDEPFFLITMETLPGNPKIDDHAARMDFGLTKREAEIVSYIYKGYRNAEIADRLFISEGTVKNHLRSIFEKAGVKNRTGLIHKVLSL
ncbi:MAG: LuxR C-terminal-related transcriptional regulator [Thermodesulfobacteriota bacterium]